MLHAPLRLGWPGQSMAARRASGKPIFHGSRDQLLQRDEPRHLKVSSRSFHGTGTTNGPREMRSTGSAGS